MKRTPQARDAVDKLGGKINEIDATSLARQVGNVRTMNVVMLGALSGTGKLPVSTETLKQVIKENVPPKTIDVNLRTFELGFEATKNSSRLIGPPILANI